MNRIVLLLAALWLLGSNPASAQTRPGAADPPARSSPPGTSPGAAGPVTSEELYARARKHEQAGDWSAALDDYRLAKQLQHGNVSWDAAANHGNAAYQHRAYVEAATMLRLALDELPADEPHHDLYRAKIGERLQAAMAHVAALSISCNEAGARITVNGEFVGEAPLSHEVLVMPGALVVRAAREAGPDLWRRLRLRAGTTQAIRMDFPRVASERDTAENDKQLPASLSGQAAPGRRAEWFSSVGVTALVLGAAGVATATGLLISSADQYEREVALAAEVDSANQWIVANPCGTGPISIQSCAALRRAARNADAQRAGSIGAFAAGGVAAASGLILLLLDAGSDEAPIDGLSWQPRLSLLGAGVDMTIRF